MSSDLLYDTLVGLVREQLEKSCYVLSETQAKAIYDRNAVPSSYWSEIGAGYRVALIKHRYEDGLACWVVVKREFVQTKFLPVELDGIERAVGDALGVKVELLEGGEGGLAPIVHVRGILA
jgi:hypothetical protein